MLTSIGGRLQLRQRDADRYFFGAREDGLDQDIVGHLAFLEEFLPRSSNLAKIDDKPASSVHEAICQFIMLADRVASGHIVEVSRSCPELVTRCVEYIRYLEQKCSEFGATDVSKWDEGIAFEFLRDDTLRVVAEVVEETVDHLHDFCNSKTTALQIQTMADDSQKGRKYFYWGSDTAMVETHADTYLLLDLHDVDLTPTILKTGWWEPWIEMILRSVLEPGMAYVNAGANVGYHTVLGAQLVGSKGRVFSFEANPKVYELLRRSIYFNGFSERVTLYHAAVNDRFGEIEFHYCPQHLGGGGIRPQAPEGTAVTVTHHKEQYWDEVTAHTTVPAITLDQALKTELDQLDLLHMDIEGAEGPALVGARDLISASSSLRMIIEWSDTKELPPAFVTKLKAAAEFLISERFKFYVILPPDGNIYSNTPTLKAVDPGNLLSLAHCDLFLTRQ